MKNPILLFILMLSLGFSALRANFIRKTPPEVINKPVGPVETATFATGCFWCGEAKFSQLKGVIKVTAGYTGGHVAHPGYEEVCTGTTGHAEAFNVVFDSSVISYDELLQAFFLSHDPTQLNRQGNDVGTQYRSAIFYHNEEQHKKAQYYISQLTGKKIYPRPIVTEVTAFRVFYDAEKMHQDYYKNNPEQGYCRYVIQPQLEEFKRIFKNKLKQ
ncbi:peptide-methionine (S)-S-oxide reductase [Pedobacter westerhofensis]|uniref:Peptide methionine sulfoxide reductase MsrA n=1 Tax=Pedobacter westerhofensis TaxID=425512 RepID=A0A521D4D9_9SPHI|nr:peptide-methionine (S)-S-oxide reductase MsrA [Pedobacter westerhofensis]SMO65750.1 peptide-methionine (S)-S-oxide reductase [Pedobacter westerhofensis]